MFSHIMIGSNDIERSKVFYDAVLAVLGVTQSQRNESTAGRKRVFYSHAGSRFIITEPLDGAPATPGNGSTIGFACSGEAQVLEFADVAVRHGGQIIENPPGLRQVPGLRFFAAYVRDPDGNKLCAMHLM